MARIVADQVLVALGLDPKDFKAGINEAGKASNKFMSLMERNAKKFAALSAIQAVSFAAQVAAIKNVTKEYAQAEAALQNLETNLRAESRTRKDAIKILNDQAAALQLVTRFSDEQLTTLQATLAAYGQTDAAIEKLTPLILDTAESFRDAEGNALDFKTVTLAVGKALNGNSGALQKLGIDLGLAKGETLTLEKATSALESRFGGAALAAGKTFAGQMAIANNQVSELKEKIGAALAPVIIDLTNKLVPLLDRLGKWVEAHRSVVLAIVGGGLAGSGVIAALSSLGTAIGIFGASAGPVALAILGISALVGWLIKLRLEAEQLPLTLGEVNSELDEQQKLANKLNQELNARRAAGQQSARGGVRGLLGGATLIPGAPQSGAELDALQYKLDAVLKRIEALQKARDRLATPAAGGTTVGGIDAGVGAASQEISPFGPKHVEASLLEGRRAMAKDLLDINNETLAAIEKAEIESIERRKKAAEEQHQFIADKVTGVAFLWGDTFAAILQSEGNFAQAFGKAMLVAMVKIVSTEVRGAITKIIITKVTQLGKAAIMAPLSFGATLAATGPIIAASAAAIGALGAIEGKMAKGFESGGIIPRTGHFLMHEGEVVFNPRRNTSSDLARNLARAGASREALAVAASGGSGGVTANFYGDIRSQSDVMVAMRRMQREWQTGLGTSVG